MSAPETPRSPRRSRAAARAASPGEDGGSPSPKSSREAEREAKIDAGLRALDLWLHDLIHQGLGALDDGAPFLDMARRLEDAQARGLARRVRRMADLTGDPGRLLARLGGLTLIREAWHQRANLPAPLLADLRGVIGFEQRKELALANTPWITDTWLVLGQHDEPDDPLTARRTFLFGTTTGRDAMILQFSAKDAPFVWSASAGELHRLTLAFWPSAWPLRALIQEEHGAPSLSTARPPGIPTLNGLLDRYATVLAARPWVGQIATVLHDVWVFGAEATRRDARDTLMIAEAGPSGSNRAGSGDCLPIRTSDPWTLLSLAGGQPVDLAVTWDGDVLRPLSMWENGVWNPL